MTVKEATPRPIDVKQVLADDPSFSGRWSRAWSRRRWRPSHDRLTQAVLQNLRYVIDGSSAQSHQFWEPCPSRVRMGTPPGYIVLTKELPQNPVVSAERHFLPGVGLVREVIVQALDGRDGQPYRDVPRGNRTTDGSGE